MKKYLKMIAVILIIFILSNEACTAMTTFSLDEAKFYGQAKSYFKGDLRKSTMSIKEKGKAISGAFAGGGLSLSLDFMKIFEDGPPYQKLFGNITKGPTAVYNFNVAVAKQPFIIRDTEYNITTAYFTVYKAKQQADRNLNRYKEAEEKLNQGKLLYAKAEITKEALDEQEKKVTEAKNKYDTSLTDYSNKITKLNDLVYLKNKLKYSDYKELQGFVSKYRLPGQDVGSLFSSQNYIGFQNLSNSYSFDMQLKRARVGSDVLPSLVDTAIKNNWEANALQLQQTIDEYYIYACLYLYQNEFGWPYVAGLSSMVGAGLFQIDDLDFTLKYDQFVSYLIARYGENWSPYYDIKILFLRFKIPRLFKYDQYDGVRYLEDSRYELQQRVMQFLQLIIDLDNQKKTVANITTNLFLEINKLDKDYEDLQVKFSELKKTYDLNQVKYKNGQLKADILISQKDELDEVDDKIFSTLIDMNEKILELSYLTNGLYDSYTVSYDMPVQKTNSSPFLAPNLDDLLESVDKLNKQSFTINYQIDTVAKNDVKVATSDLGLSVEGEGFDCNQYRVVTADGIEISELLNMSDKFRHFTTVFNNLADLRIKLYKNGVEKYTAEFDGYGVLGKLKLK